MKGPLPDRSALTKMATEAALQMPSIFGMKKKTCVYVSAPITTGPALMAHARSVGGSRNHAIGALDEDSRLEIIRNNIERVRPVIENVRLVVEDLVIDPTPLHVSAWSQQDYHEFWCDVIREWCHSLVATQGWGTSTGCCTELRVALTLGLRVLDETLRPLTLENIGMEVEVARDELEGLGLLTPQYEQASSELQRAVLEASRGATTGPDVGRVARELKRLGDT